MDRATTIAIIGLILSLISIFAIYYGPIQALKIQRALDAEREARNRKLQIFKTLMGNRVTRLAPAYVQALNLIDVEFTREEPKERAVRDAWKELNDLYANYKNTANAEDKANELNATLLVNMGKCLGYDFDRVVFKEGCVLPGISLQRRGGATFPPTANLGTFGWHRQAKNPDGRI